MPHADRSLWLERAAGPRYQPLATDVEVDVAIVGGGIVGTTLALILAEHGNDAVLVEARTIGSGTTGNSTAKAVVHQGFNFSRLVDQMGVEGATRVVHGDRAALDIMRRWADELGVSDAARPAWHWSWATDEEGEATLEAERAAAVQLGVEVRWATPDDRTLGTKALGAPDHLLLEPAVLLDAFAAHAHASGVSVYEQTRVTGVSLDDDEYIELETGGGAKIRAKRVVLATQVPIVDRTLAFAGCDYHRSHVVALHVTDDTFQTTDMHTGIDSGGLSLRPGTSLDGAPLLVVAGHGHDLGTDEDGTHVNELIEHARRVTGAGELHSKWLAHDAFPTDDKPYIGASGVDDRLFIATGFAGWGLARGAAASMSIAAKLIRGHEEFHEAFDATRLGGLVRPGAIKMAAKTVVAVVGDRLTTDEVESVTSLVPGAGTVVRVDGTPTAVARDEAGALHAVSATCTHLGCLVRHEVERNAWQCPCHGSRFAIDGTVLNGPAMKDLHPVELPAELRSPARGS
ncbi:MAG: iron-sulfur binding oxidoreductase [Thermoleophilia bacterium]|jgi:glycine/D-amino acid oxidase-like deaminating enzyme/nitrite reductase/ring-hydroxylating ferredoxin subunit|nr:iron-sulfur binding oxidoreductase [Thermoleophilia bacterium]